MHNIFLLNASVVIKYICKFNKYLLNPHQGLGSGYVIHIAESKTNKDVSMELSLKVWRQTVDR